MGLNTDDYVSKPTSSVSKLPSCFITISKYPRDAARQSICEKIILYRVKTDHLCEVRGTLQLRNGHTAHVGARDDHTHAFVRGLFKLGRARSKIGETVHRVRGVRTSGGSGRVEEKALLDPHRAMGFDVGVVFYAF